MNALGDNAWSSEVKRPEHLLIAKYHAHLANAAQDHILTQFPLVNSSVRVVIATIAFGLGVDIKDVRRVIHWGPSRSLLQYWQEVGRCSRDGKPGSACIYVLPRSLSQRLVTDDIRSMCRQESICIRQFTLKALHLPEMGENALNELLVKNECKSNCENCNCPKCLRCVVCRNSCQCRDC